MKSRKEIMFASGDKECPLRLVFDNSFSRTFREKLLTATDTTQNRLRSHRNIQMILEVNFRTDFDAGCFVISGISETLDQAQTIVECFQQELKGVLPIIEFCNEPILLDAFTQWGNFHIAFKLLPSSIKELGSLFYTPKYGESYYTNRIGKGTR